MSARVVRSLVVILFVQCSVPFLQAAAQDPDAGFVIEGTVTDSRGRAIEGAKLEWGYWLADREDYEFATTNENGRYRLVTTNQGPDCRLGVSVVGFAPNYRDGIIPTDRVTEIDFTLLPPISVRGILVDSEGKPLSGVKVDITSRSWLNDHPGMSISFRFPGPDNSRVTDKNGRFEIRYLPASLEQRKNADGVTYNLNVRQDKKILKSFHVSSKGENRIQMSRRQLNRYPTIQHFGKIVDENGDPISQFWIRDYQARDLSPQTQSTFRYLGKYGFHIHAHGYETLTVRDLVANDIAQPVEYRLTPGETLEGRVIGSDGAIPKADVLVGGRIHNGKVDWISSIERPEYRLQSDENGQFSINCPKGPKRKNPVIVGAPGYRWKVVDIEQLQGKDKVIQDIELTPSLPIIRVKAKFANKPAANNLFVISNQNGLAVRGRLDDAGIAQIDRLPPGVYNLTLTKRPVHGARGFDMAVIAKKIEITEAGPTELELENPANGITVTGSTYPFAIVTARLVRELGSTKFIRHHFDEFRGPHIFGTLADANGNYEITGLTPGSYAVVAWNQLRTHPEYQHTRTHGNWEDLETDQDKIDLLSGSTR